MNSPENIARTFLKNWFNHPAESVYCQVSTTLDQTPQIRTMDLSEITSDGHIRLQTYTETRKWSTLRQNPKIAICILSLKQGQITIEGTATLKTILTDSATIQAIWDKKLPYWKDFYLSHSESTTRTNDIPHCFGVIEVIPRTWEILEINPDDFLKSTRTLYVIEGNQWLSTSAELS